MTYASRPIRHGSGDLWILGTHRSKITKQQSVRCLAWLMGRCRPTDPYSTGDLDAADRDKLTEGQLLVSNSKQRPGGMTVGGSNPHLDPAGAERSSAPRSIRIGSGASGTANCSRGGRNQLRTYLLKQSIVRCQARSAAALLYRSGVASQLKPCTAPG